MTNEEKKIIESSNYEVIVVIGNGFDVNLGLKTKYSDFIQSDIFQEEMISNSLFQYLFTRYTQSTDYTYFQDFFVRLFLYSLESGKSVIVFYYGENNYYDIHKRIDEMSKKSISGIKQRNELLLIDLQEVTA